METNKAENAHHFQFYKIHNSGRFPMSQHHMPPENWNVEVLNESIMNLLRSDYDHHSTKAAKEPKKEGLEISTGFDSKNGLQRDNDSHECGTRFLSKTVPSSAIRQPSISSAVTASSYSSLPPSPAVSFLSSIAEITSLSRASSVRCPAGRQKSQSMDWTGDFITSPSSGSSFRIGKKIGVGNFASEGVYEAFPSNENSDLVLAIKIVKNESCFEVSKKEAEIWSSLDHKNIVKFYEYFNLDSESFFVMEYCRNGNLLAYINSQPEGVFIPEESVAFIFNQICEGVRYMHEEAMIVHRDIKLENILLSTDYKGHLVAKICDFGLSSKRKVNLSVSLDRCNALRRKSCAPSRDRGGSAGRGPEREDKNECVGSLAYCAPEVLDPSLLNNLHSSSAIEVGSKRSFHSSISIGRSQAFSDTLGTTADDEDFDLKKAADIWALGIVLYAMLTNKLPFACEFQPRMHLMIVTGDYERIQTKQNDSSIMFNSSARLESGESERLCSVEAKDLVEGLLEMNVQQRLKIMQVLNSRFLCSKLQ